MSSCGLFPAVGRNFVGVPFPLGSNGGFGRLGLCRVSSRNANLKSGRAPARRRVGKPASTSRLLPLFPGRERLGKLREDSGGADGLPGHAASDGRAALSPRARGAALRPGDGARCGSWGAPRGAGVWGWGLGPWTRVLPPAETPEEVLEALKTLGYSFFRPGQEVAVMRILSGGFLPHPGWPARPQTTSPTLLSHQASPRWWCYRRGWGSPSATSSPLTSTTNAPTASPWSSPPWCPWWMTRYRSAVDAAGGRGKSSGTLPSPPAPSHPRLRFQVSGLPPCLKAVCVHSNMSKTQRDAAMEKVRERRVPSSPGRTARRRVKPLVSPLRCRCGGARRRCCCCPPRPWSAGAVRDAAACPPPLACRPWPSPASTKLTASPSGRTISVPATCGSARCEAARGGGVGGGKPEAVGKAVGSEERRRPSGVSAGPSLVQLLHQWPGWRVRASPQPVC